jgi:hypothetical protein
VPGGGPLARVTGPIAVGTDVRATFIGMPIVYELRAPSSGTLVTRLTWDPAATGGKLMLTVNGATFKSSRPTWSPLVARVAVSSGQTVYMEVDEGYAPWESDFNVPFLLTTAIE